MQFLGLGDDGVPDGEICNKKCNLAQRFPFIIVDFLATRQVDAKMVMMMMLLMMVNLVVLSSLLAIHFNEGRPPSRMSPPPL